MAEYLDDAEVRITMPREYSDHPLCRQLMTLKDEEALKDVEVAFGVSGRVERMSGFLLSLLSPVWRARLCGEFSHGRGWRLELEEEEAELLQTVLGISGGRLMRRGLEELLDLGRLAEFYQMDEVRRAVEEEALRHLKIETCARMHSACATSGLRRVEQACRRMALERFEELMRTDGFMGMGEDTLRSLLEDDRLECESEEVLFEGVLRWMQGPAGGGSAVRAEDLLDTIRFPVMGRDYLMTSAMCALERSERLERLVSDALVLKGLPAEERSKHVNYIGDKALRERLGWGVMWGEYVKGRRFARKIFRSNTSITCLVDCGDWVCHPSCEGITVWNKANLEVERKLTVHGGQEVRALAVCRGWLVSVSRSDNLIRVWDVKRGQCVKTLEGRGSVQALAVSEKRLLGGSEGGRITVWRLDGAPSTWWCERTLTVRDARDTCHHIALWGRKAVSGYSSGAIRVWDLSTGECVRTLQGHTDYVTALAVREGRLMSASGDKSVREWCLESGACVKVVEVYPAKSSHVIQCLTLSGRKLVGGSASGLAAIFQPEIEQGPEEVVVWDLDTWAEEQRLKLRVGNDVMSLLAMEGEVWACVDAEVWMWGREGDGAPPSTITATNAPLTAI